MIALYLLIALVLAGLAYLLTLPSSYTVTRSITIAKPVNVVFEQVQDFNKWLAWSPWLIHDANTINTIENPTQVGGSSTWDSAKIGSGKTTHQAIVPNQSIRQQLDFYKPFKSTAQIDWTFTQADGATTVTWTMSSGAALPMRPFLKYIEHMIGQDFELGLAQLRGIVDTQAEKPVITFDGPCTLPAQSYVSQHYTGSFEGMKAAMAQAYPALYERAQGRIQGNAIAAYHKVDILKQTTVCDMAVPVSDVVAGETVLDLTGGRYYCVRLQGSYTFLGNAWNAATGHVRMEKLKLDKHRPMLEVYVNTPDQVQHSNELTTLLYVAIKG